MVVLSFQHDTDTSQIAFCAVCDILYTTSLAFNDKTSPQHETDKQLQAIKQLMTAKHSKFQPLM